MHVDFSRIRCHYSTCGQNAQWGWHLPPVRGTELQGLKERKWFYGQGSPWSRDNWCRGTAQPTPEVDGLRLANAGPSCLGTKEDCGLEAWSQETVWRLDYLTTSLRERETDPLTEGQVLGLCIIFIPSFWIPQTLGEVTYLPSDSEPLTVNLIGLTLGLQPSGL